MPLDYFCNSHYVQMYQIYAKKTSDKYIDAIFDNKVSRNKTWSIFPCVGFIMRKSSQPCGHS